MTMYFGNKNILNPNKLISRSKCRIKHELENLQGKTRGDSKHSKATAEHTSYKNGSRKAQFVEVATAAVSIRFLVLAKAEI
jgi:hypothetical protein